MFAYLTDVESDMSVFHRIDDVRAMPARLFIDRALRLTAYKGVMRALAEAEQDEDTGAPDAHAGRDGSGVRHVESSAVNLVTDPGFGGAFDVRQG